MLKNKFVICLFIIFLLFVSAIESQSQSVNESYSSGLMFRSHDVNKDERTSLNLTPDGSKKIPQNFDLEFDLKLSYSSHSYGYIFRIVVNDTASIDMTSNIVINKLRVILNDKNRVKADSEYNIDRRKFENKWRKITIKVSNNVIRYTIDGHEITINESFENIKDVKILFGANKHEHFYSSDVPPMSVKNVVIRDGNGLELRNWKMSKHGEGVVADSIGNYPAAVSNGVWEIDKHTKWNREESLTTEERFPQVAYDSIDARVFVFAKDSLYILHAGQNRIEKIKVKEGEPFRGASSYVIYDRERDQVVSYNTDQSELLTYDFEQNKWSGEIIHKSLRIQHHNRLINPYNDELIVLGGYGYYEYKATIATHSLAGGGWFIEDIIDRMSPRYLASLGYFGDNKILVFGGYGNESGMQEAPTRNFYDLYKIDLGTKDCVRLGEITDVNGHYTFGNSMVVAQNKERFYTLGYRNDMYRTSVSLFEVDIKNMSSRILADSILYNFQDIESYCDLFLHQNRSLYAIILQKKGNNTFEIGVHSLLYLPLSQDDVIQLKSDVVGESKFRMIYLCLFVLVIMVLIYIFGRRRSNKKGGYHRSANKKSMGYMSDNISDRAGGKTFSSIFLLGGFQAFDKEGNDISNYFTPIVRQIFLINLLESATAGKGMTSEKLGEVFWFDLSKTKATNNRNVNISKLRLLLQDIGDVKLSKNGNYWQISMGDDIFCDYTEIMKKLKNIKLTKDIDKLTIESIIDLALSGVLLPNIDADWADKYKSDYSTLLIDVLMSSVTHADIHRDLKLMIKLADTILLHDNIDEDSIQIKCRSLYQLGQKGLSKQCYDKYCSDYSEILNEEAKLKYESIINTEIK